MLLLLLILLNFLTLRGLLFSPATSLARGLLVSNGILRVMLAPHRKPRRSETVGHLFEVLHHCRRNPLPVLFCIAQSNFVATHHWLFCRPFLRQEMERVSELVNLGHQKLAAMHGFTLFKNVLENVAEVVRPIILVAQSTLKIHPTNIFHVLFFALELSVTCIDKFSNLFNRFIEAWVRRVLLLGVEQLL